MKRNGKIEMMALMSLSMVLLVQFPSANCQCKVEYEVPVRLKVTVLYKQQGVQNRASYLKEITSSRDYKKAYNSLDVSSAVSASASASAAGVSGSMSVAASFAMSTVSDKITEKNRYKYTEKKDSVAFKPNFLQLYQDVKTEITVDGKTARQTESQYLDSIPTSAPLTEKELRRRSTQYLNEHFPGEKSKIRGTSYTSISCIKDEAKYLKYCVSNFEDLDCQKILCNECKYGKWSREPVHLPYCMTTIIICSRGLWKE